MRLVGHLQSKEFPLNSESTGGGRQETHHLEIKDEDQSKSFIKLNNDKLQL